MAIFLKASLFVFSAFADEISERGGVTSVTVNVDADVGTQSEQSGLTVECEIELYDSDVSPGNESQDEDGLEWGQCTTDNGDTYYLLDDDNLESIAPSQKVRLVLEVANDIDIPDAPWTLQNEPIYRIVSMTLVQDDANLVQSDAESDFQGTQEMSILTMILQYQDKSATEYASTTAVMDWLYMQPNDPKFGGSFSDMVAKASFGRLVAPRRLGHAIIVRIPEQWASKRGCPYNDFSAKGRKYAKEQHPNVDLTKYKFHQFYIPKSPSGGCTWGGLANVGCGHPGSTRFAQKSRPCTAWYRVTGAFVIAHELGHNLGLLHAGGTRGSTFVEYGDPASSMGASYRMSSFSVAARHQMDLLKSNEWTEYRPQSGTQLFKVQSMSVQTGTISSTSLVGVRIACASCVPKVSAHRRITGGYLWVSFRGDEGYSSVRLSTTYQNKVYVHLARKYSSKYYGKGTEQWAKLDQGKSFTDANLKGVSVFFCGVAGDVATVAITSMSNPSQAAVCADSSFVVVNPGAGSRRFSSVHPAGASYDARINGTQPWQAGSSAVGEWMELDLGKSQTVVGVVVQGGVPAANWVKTFAVKYLSGSNWVDVMPNSPFGVFDQPMDNELILAFPRPVTSQRVRIYPLEWTKQITMRAAVLVQPGQ